MPSVLKKPSLAPVFLMICRNVPLLSSVEANFRFQCSRVCGYKGAGFDEGMQFDRGYLSPYYVDEG